ncbi:transposase [Roseofilum sp. BLCC_M154]|uniref:Transposase n=1 Tax=Roseofilum acuticapitatum BLCC-M154 TaxID=3022444 RepID=A0ABT7ANZ4_9CYAN|nr:hypothetical protein [Roseofilum acuticapitatum]MDJ1168322.1 transposase [Roseofilum acuticapitatum BLCC-M154]
MSPRKLTESEKVDIIKTYRETAETTSTLATRYSVSNSTISRLLKARLPATEYENLVQQKRAAAGKGKMPTASSEQESDPPKGTKLQVQKVESASASPALEAKAEGDEPEDVSVDRRPKKVRSRSTSASQSAKGVIHPSIPGLNLLSSDLDGDRGEEDEDEYYAQASTLRELLGEDLDEEDLDEDEDEDEDEDYESDRLTIPGRVPAKVEVLPLSEAALPRICYLVIDRTAELITRPLKEFAQLGQIPSSEVGERTLPVFDNHRVARRFSRRSQRVIKVPDSRMLPKTSPYLYAKGITRLLFDGQVYSLDDN